MHKNEIEVFHIFRTIKRKSIGDRFIGERSAILKIRIRSNKQQGKRERSHEERVHTHTRTHVRYTHTPSRLFINVLSSTLYAYASALRGLEYVMRAWGTLGASCQSGAIWETMHRCIGIGMRGERGEGEEDEGGKADDVRESLRLGFARLSLSCEVGRIGARYRSLFERPHSSLVCAKLRKSLIAKKERVPFDLLIKLHFLINSNSHSLREKKVYKTITNAI